MNLSIFDNDGTLGAVTPLGQVLITATGIVPNASAAGLKRQVEAALSAGSWTVVSVNGTYNSTFSLASVRVAVKMYQTLDANTIRNWFLTDMAAAGLTFSGVSVVVTERYTQAPDLVGSASTFSPTVRGGQLATVNVPISFDDDPATVKPGAGVLDTIKGLDTTTMVLIGLAAVLVLKRL